MRKIAFIAAVAIAWGLIALGVCHAVTCPSGYSYYRSVTIDHTQAGSSDTSNFAVLLSTRITSSLATSGNGGKLQNANGYDFVLSSTTDGNYGIHFETETYTSTNGTIVYWAQLPTLSHSADIVLYAFYDNSGVSTFQGGAKSGVWDTNYQAVYHLGLGSNISTLDSTSNGINGTNHNATATTGQIGTAAAFDGSTEYIGAMTLASNLNPPYTVSGWFSLANLTYNYPIAIGRTTYTVDMRYSGTSDQMEWTGSGYDPKDPTPVAANVWHYFVGISTSGMTHLYRDGSDVADSGGSSDTFQSFEIGRRFDGQWFPGSVDEVRISNVARSGDQILAEYNNQKTGSTMVTWGAETSCGVAAPSSNALWFGGE